MIEPWVGTAIALMGLGITIVVQLRGGVWNQADREAKMKRELSDEIKASAITAKDGVDKLRSETSHSLASLHIDLEKARKEAIEQHDDSMEKFGETIASIKQKVNDEALYAERHFVKKDDHKIHMDSHQKTLDTLDRKIDDRFNRMERLIFDGPLSTTRRGGGSPHTG